MKNHGFIIIPLILILLIFSCGKDDDVSGTQNEPVPSFQISFYAVDSAGNLVFPVDDSYLSEFIPDDFSASSEFTQDIGVYNSNSTYGHVFRIRESSQLLINNYNVWQEDSILYFFSCFGTQCDTITVFNPFSNSSFTSSAERIYWNGDTIFDYTGWVLPYELNN